MQSQKKSGLLLRIVPFFLIVLGFLGVLLLDKIPQRDVAFKIIQEGGPIEILTAFILFFGGIVCLLKLRKINENKIFWLEFAIIFFAFGIRELDPHRLVEDFNFLRMTFYVSPKMPLFYKVLYGFSLFGLTATLLHFVFTNAKFFLVSLKKNELWTWTAVGFVLAEAIACLHHKATKFIFTKIFMRSDRDGDFLLEALEEPFEMIAAGLFCWTAIQICRPMLSNNKISS